MNNTHRSAGGAVVAIGVAAALLIVGFFVFAVLRQRPERPLPTPRSSPTEEKAMEETNAGVMKKDESDAMKGKNIAGTVLAGTSSPFIDFNPTDYEAAVATDKLIVLYFYANWCPICREEVPQLIAAFNELTTDQVVGFRVNYNDTDTDDAERALAREHGVGYQHTKVFVRQRQRVLKSPETWTKDRYLTEIQAHAPAPVL